MRITPEERKKYPSGSYLKCQLKTAQCGINSLITFFNTVDNFDQVFFENLILKSLNCFLLLKAILCSSGPYVSTACADSKPVSLQRKRRVCKGSMANISVTAW